MQRQTKLVYFTSHAEIRLIQRRISKQAIRSTVHHPIVVHQVDPPRKRFEKDLANGRRLAVIAEERRKAIVVISTWWM